MSDFVVTIVGAGVIGTSLGLALKQVQDPPRLIAHDKDLAIAQAGVKKGAFDKAEWNLINATEKADLIVLAIPLSGIRSTLAALAPEIKQGMVITDTAHSKTPVLAWARELLPAHAHFIGGNPLVHPAGLGQQHATAGLFRGRLYCLTPAPSAAEEAVQLLAGFVSLLGAEPFFLDAVEHDGLMTAVEHLPTVASVALLNTLQNQGSWREMRKLAGSVFEQSSLGATGEPEALKESLLANRDNLIHWLDAFMEQLRQLRLMLASEEPAEELARLLQKAVTERENWLKDYERGSFTDPELITPKVEGGSFMKRLLGMRR